MSLKVSDHPLFPRRRFVFATLGTGAALLIGCGQTEYDQRMGAVSGILAKRGMAAANDRLEANYTSVMDPSGAPTGIKFKRPAIFVPPKGKQLGATDAGAKLAQADIPGFCYALQATLADYDNRQISAYCYVFAVPKATTPVEPLKMLIAQGLAPVVPNLIWTSGNRGGLPIHATSGTGTLNFEVNGAPQQLPGSLQLTIVEGPEKIVLIAFSQENASEAKNKLSEHVSESLQSIAADGPAAAPPGPMPPGPPGPAGS